MKHTTELAHSTASRNYYISFCPEWDGTYTTHYYSINKKTGKNWQGVKSIYDSNMDAFYKSEYMTIRGYSTREKALAAIMAHAA